MDGSGCTLYGTLGGYGSSQYPHPVRCRAESTDASPPASHSALITGKILTVPSVPPCTLSGAAPPDCDSTDGAERLGHKTRCVPQGHRTGQDRRRGATDCCDHAALATARLRRVGAVSGLGRAGCARGACAGARACQGSVPCSARAAAWSTAVSVASICAARIVVQRSTGGSPTLRASSNVLWEPICGSRRRFPWGVRA